MMLRRIILKEIRHRKLGFVLSIASVLVAVGVFVAQITLLDAHDLRTAQILAAKQAETEAEMRRMEDDYRKIMKKLGFNLLILPGEQNLADFYTEGCAGLDMPEEYVRTLADSDIMTIRHLLPIVERKTQWPEQQRTIILAGTRGEVPLAHRDPKEPMLLAVPPGRAVLGSEIWRGLSLAVGDTITLLGESFQIIRCHPPRGNRDDATIWIDLAKAQELLHCPGRINAILALKCHCAGAQLVTIREEIGRILPGAQIIETSDKVLVRAEARARAKTAAEQAIDAEREHRAQLRAELSAFASWFLPLVTLAAVVWIGLLTLMNVRERRTEIGILRAVGLQSRQIITVFLGRAVLIGLLGGLMGYGTGFAIGLFSGGITVETDAFAGSFRADLLVLAIAATPLLAALASMPPSLLAVRQDPAFVLREN